MNRATYSALLGAVVAAASCAYPDFAIESATDATGGVKHSGGSSGTSTNVANGGSGHGGAGTAGIGPNAAGGLAGQAGLTGGALGGNAGEATGGASAFGGVTNTGGVSPATGSAGGFSVAGGPTMNGGTSFGGTASGGTVGRGGQAAAGAAGTIAGAGNQGGAVAGSAGATAQAGSPAAGTGAAAGALAGGGASGGGAAGGGAATCGAQLLVNPNFDLGENGWTTYSSSGYTVVTSETNASAPTLAQTAPYFAWLGGHNNQTTSISQPISIPAGFTSASLSFHYFIRTNETTTTKAYDVMTVELLDVGSGSVLQTLKTLSNLDATSGWTLETVTVTGAFGGSTVVMRFYVTTGSSYVTDFCVDTVAFKLAPC